MNKPQNTHAKVRHYMSGDKNGEYRVIAMNRRQAKKAAERLKNVEIIEHIPCPSPGDVLLDQKTGGAELKAMRDWEASQGGSPAKPKAQPEPQPEAKTEAEPAKEGESMKPYDHSAAINEFGEDMTVKQLKTAIDKISDPDEVSKFLQDESRQTAISAIKDRVEELKG